ncbi:hypothetical protein [Microcoleus sp. LAD1_D1]
MESTGLNTVKLPTKSAEGNTLRISTKLAIQHHNYADTTATDLFQHWGVFPKIILIVFG